MGPSFIRLVALLLTTPASKNVSFQVCLSPGCLADGARQTLDKLQALAPHNLDISAGTCESLCGNGPIVSQLSEKKKVTHRRVSGDALLDLLSDYAIDPKLLEGYELVSQAQEWFLKKEYSQAMSLYEKGIRMALEPAKALLHLDPQEGDGMPKRVEWLVRAYRQEAESRLQLGDHDGALVAAKAACNLSNNADAASLEVLASVCQAGKNVRGELEALQALFALPEDAKMSREVANRRRTLGFRLAKLEREVDTTATS